MGALEDYYKRNHDEAQQRLIDQQNAARAQGLDPALAGQPYAPAPAASPLGVAAGADPNAQLDPRVNGASGYYAPTNTGSVVAGDRNVFETLTGVDKTQVTPAIQGMIPDKGDIPLVNAAMADYDAKHNEWLKQLQIQADDINKNGYFSKYFKGYKAFAASEPQKPDLTAIQHMSDRDRLLTTIGGTYEPLIAQLSEAAAGRGPSAAMDAYRTAADDASKRNYGIAASSKGTGGQRAALFQAALGQNAQDSQAAARQGAIIAAQDQNNARASLNSTLAGLTNVYGEANLLGDTTHSQDRNNNAYNEAIALKAKIESDNSGKTSDFVKSNTKTGAEVLEHI